ncbi:MAG TPA: MBL fold metallo-hydrolase [Gaiellaceae bacterium]|nr:MBL fold metallo-hydrolase [Gaiellaceae bacterium]
MSLTHADLTPVAAAAWAAVARPDLGAAGNAGFVDLGGSTVVFDTHVTVAAGHELRAAADAVAPVQAVALSHWHLDHVLGGQAFGGIRSIATAETRRLIQERALPRVTTLRSTVDDWLPEQLAELRAAGKNAAADLWERLAAEELPTVEVVPPDEVFTDERELVGERRRAALITYGGGHTASDAFLWLEDERILFAADLVVNGDHAWVGDGDVSAWIGILERISELGPRSIVPGHGAVCGPETIELMLRYLDDVRRAEPGSPVPDAYSHFPTSSMWERNLRALAGA